MFSGEFKSAVRSAEWEKGAAAIVPGKLMCGIMNGAHNYANHYAGRFGTERFATDVASMVPKLRRPLVEEAVLAFLDARAPELQRTYPAKSSPPSPAPSSR